MDWPLVVTTLQRSAARLQHLILNNAAGMSTHRFPCTRKDSYRDVEFPELKVVEFDRCAIRRSDSGALALLRQMARTSRQLEEFRFVGKSAWIGEEIDEHVTAADFVDCLRSSRGTLRVLSIDLTKFIFQVNQLSCPPLDRAALVDFTRLKKISLEDASFCHHHRLADPTSHLLPVSVRHLILRVYHAEATRGGGGGGAWDDITELACQTGVAGRFSNLRKVKLRVTVGEEYGTRDVSTADGGRFVAEVETRRKAIRGLCTKSGVLFSI
ncbi:hypothetical protein Micbo1qcDRAFT_171572 [Microdochium bolleyi]|uniref:F-box domain-containing protein n=1 Tax=Microdochium bolleyi TaxID=196109 RepID=A0A136JDE8_9PEZI|nr:hypothetical protein Micbo1qcDRAFT_171572 [Microdochium bolleyi]